MGLRLRAPVLFRTYATDRACCAATGEEPKREYNLIEARASSIMRWASSSSKFPYCDPDRFYRIAALT